MERLDTDALTCEVMKNVVQFDIAKDCKQHAIDELMAMRKIQEVKKEMIKLEEDRMGIIKSSKGLF